MADPQRLADGAVDPNVRIPDHVKQSAAEADALHGQFYPKNPEQPPAPAKDAVPQIAVTPETPVADVHPAPPAVSIPEIESTALESGTGTVQSPLSDPVAVTDGGDNDQTWRHKFLTMQGRFNAQAKNIGAMEQQMRELAQELVRTQGLLSSASTHPPSPADQRQSHHNNLITGEDRENYGDDLIDLAQRAAKAAITPELEALRQENQRLNRTVNTSVKTTLFNQVTDRIPNWRHINRMPQWLAWLALPNLYTGEVRQKMLDRAIAGAEAPKVIQLFKDFLAEANATGLSVPTAQTEQDLSHRQDPPRTPALSLETLAAPGKARPAPGDSHSTPSDKPIYTRDQITQFYKDSRRGLYAGREAEYRAVEADLTRAQAEGRIR